MLTFLVYYKFEQVMKLIKTLYKIEITLHMFYKVKNFALLGVKMPATIHGKN